MGNCLVFKEQVVRVMTVNGKALEYKSPVRVYEVLSKFRDHAVYETLPVSKYMQANAELVSGRLYHLVPLQKQSPKTGKKRVRFSIPEKDGEESPSLRVKLVISKLKLREMVETGVLPVDGMVAVVQGNEMGGVNFNSFDDHQSDTVEKPAFG